MYKSLSVTKLQEIHRELKEIQLQPVEPVRYLRQQDEQLEHLTLNSLNLPNDQSMVISCQYAQLNLIKMNKLCSHIQTRYISLLTLLDEYINSTT